MTGTVGFPVENVPRDFVNFRTSLYHVICYRNYVPVRDFRSCEIYKIEKFVFTVVVTVTCMRSNNFLFREGIFCVQVVLDRIFP